MAIFEAGVTLSKHIDIYLPSSSSSLYIWNQGSSYLIYWQLGAQFQISRELEDDIYLGGVFKYFLFSSLPGEMIHFDEHIFEMGWFNHQLDIHIWDPSQMAPWEAVAKWISTRDGTKTEKFGLKTSFCWIPT